MFNCFVMKRLVVFSVPCGVGRGVGLYFLDAIFAFGGRKTRSLINRDNKASLPARAVEMLTSYWS